MKNFKYLLIMFVALSVSVSSCSDDDDDMDRANAIVGSWIVSEAEGGFEISIRATFKENGTGTLVTTVTIGEETQSDTSSFTWSTKGDQLTLTVDGETEVSTYSISGDTLTITDSEGFVTELTRD